VQRFDIDGWPRRFRLRFIAENAGRPLKELVFPLLDLVGVLVKLLGQFHKRLLASNGGERHFCLESRAMVPAWSSRHGISCSRHLSRSQAEIPLIPAVQISRTTSDIDEEVINMDARRLCLELGGVREQCEQLRGLETDKR